MARCMLFVVHSTIENKQLTNKPKWSCHWVNALISLNTDNNYYLILVVGAMKNYRFICLLFMFTITIGQKRSVIPSKELLIFDLIKKFSIETLFFISHQNDVVICIWIKFLKCLYLDFLCSISRTKYVSMKKMECNSNLNWS